MDKSKKVFGSALDKLRERKSVRKRIKNHVNETEDTSCHCIGEKCSFNINEIKTNDVSVE